MPKRKKVKKINPVESWWPRFWAWLIDVIIIGAIVAIIYPQNSVTFDMARSALSGAVVLIYWTLLDSNGRQSIGKKALRLMLVSNGKPASIDKAFVSAFGKSFLLPLDFIIGVLARPGQKQRLFNIAADTVVVRRQ